MHCSLIENIVNYDAVTRYGNPLLDNTVTMLTSHLQYITDA